jgi:tetratricopeptide (TPR) repeat protein
MKVCVQPAENDAIGSPRPLRSRAGNLYRGRPRGRFQTANQLYDREVQRGEAALEQLAQAGEPGANLFYNLGNTNYRLGAPGPAMLAYERALALDPAHPEARANLDLLRRQNGARLWQESWLDRVFPGRKTDIYVAVATVAAWLAVFCFAVTVITSRREKAGLWLGAIGAHRRCVRARASGTEQNRALALVIAKKTEARRACGRGPAAAAASGSQVRVLSRQGDWIYCECRARDAAGFPPGRSNPCDPRRYDAPARCVLLHACCR